MSFAYLPWYTGDYLRDTRHLSPLRHGVYLLALAHCWDSKGPMPLDEQEAAGICNCRSTDEIEALRYVMDRYFIRMEDGHYNHRMQREVERSEAISGARSNAGKLGYQAKARQLPSKRQAIAKQEPLSPSPSPSLSLTPSPILGEPPKPPPPAAASGKVAQNRAPIPAPSAETWDSYANAYASRYGTPPVRNAKVNGQLSKLVGRLGVEAPAVAAHYLGHQSALYVRAMHPVDLLLRDAESLHTAWVTGRQVTQTQATQADKTQTNVNVFGPMLAEARAREAKDKLDAQRTTD